MSAHDVFCIGLYEAIKRVERRRKVLSILANETADRETSKF